MTDRPSDAHPSRTAGARGRWSVAERLRGLRDHIASLLHVRSRHFYVFAALVLGLVVVWGSAWDALQDEIPRLRTWQLTVHRYVSQLNPRRSRAQWVTVVEVDDPSYRNPPFNGAYPANRAALGQLVRDITRVQPILIALDFQLLRDPPVAAQDNLDLQMAIGSAAVNHVPVVAGQVISEVGGRLRELPGIFRASDLPPSARIGHIEAPKDARKMALAIRAVAADGGSTQLFPSFAQQIVAAYEAATHVKRRTEDDPAVKAALAEGDFLYAGFLPMTEFDRVSAAAIFAGRTEQIEQCRHKIVLIGGTWHSPKEPTQWVEQFDSPVGVFPGVYLHANYVEALNDARYTRPLPHWVGALVDVAAALWIYVVFLRRSRRRVSIFFLVAALMLVTYVSATNVGLYLDFLPVLVLCLLHVGYEELRELKAERDHEKKRTGVIGTAAAGVALSALIVWVLIHGRPHDAVRIPAGPAGVAHGKGETPFQKLDASSEYAFFRKGPDVILPVQITKTAGDPEHEYERVSYVPHVLTVTGWIASSTKDELVLQILESRDPEFRMSFAIRPATTREWNLDPVRGNPVDVEYHVEGWVNVADVVRKARTPAPVSTPRLVGGD